MATVRSGASSSGRLKLRGSAPCRPDTTGSSWVTAQPRSELSTGISASLRRLQRADGGGDAQEASFLDHQGDCPPTRRRAGRPPPRRPPGPGRSDRSRRAGSRRDGAGAPAPGSGPRRRRAPGSAPPAPAGSSTSRRRMASRTSAVAASAEQRRRATIAAEAKYTASHPTATASPTSWRGVGTARAAQPASSVSSSRKTVSPVASMRRR